MNTRPAPLLLALLLVVPAWADEPPAEPPVEPPVEPVAQRPEAPAVPAVAVAVAGPQLLIEDLRPGSGAEAAPGMTLVVHYTGWLHAPGAPGDRGRQFDSSRARGAPLSLPLGAGRVIRGWELGLIGQRVGGLRRLVIPPELAYGSRSVGDGLIPAGSTLVFEVELLGVETQTLSEGAK